MWPNDVIACRSHCPGCRELAIFAFWPPEAWPQWVFSVSFMWEEHPEYQKAQARMIGLLVLMVFLCSLIYYVSKRDWDLFRQVLYAGVGLLVALAIFPFAAWVFVKVVGRRRNQFRKPQPKHEA